MVQKIIDTHLHLEEIEEVSSSIERAKQAGLSGVVAVGSDYGSNRKNLELSKQFSCGSFIIYVAMGIHPCNINLDEIEPTLEFIRRNGQNIVASGEIGLDFGLKGIDENQKSIQKKCLESQLEISKEINKPVIIHSRKSHKECLEMVVSHKIPKAVFHWYSGPADILRKILDKGYLISLTPALEYSGGQIQSAKFSPIENILVETDSPVRYRTSNGDYFASEPKDVVKVITRLSSIKNIDFDKLASITTENAKRFYSI